MFERGDIIIYIDKNGFYDLTLYGKYTVKSSFITIHNEQIIQIYNDKGKSIWIKSKKFIMSIKEQRKKKIQKINNE